VILGGKTLEVVDKFTYLGITLTYRGDFKVAVSELKTKAMRALFKISSSLGVGEKANAKVQIKLFDSMVKPILLYGSQAWCDILNPFMAKGDLSQIDKLPFETLQYKMCKYLLGVHQRTSNVAALAELGRYPLFITVAVLAVRFWAKLINSPDTLAHQAYQEDKNADSKDQKNWVTFVRGVLTRCNLQHIWQSQMVNRSKLSGITRIVQCELERQYRQSFFQRINNKHGNSAKHGNKLRTYCLIKNDYLTESYVNLNLPFRYSQSLAQLRTSAHRLEIEEGRKNRPKPIPAEERICKQCNNCMEDEIHFVCVCPLYTRLREILYERYDISISNFSNRELFIHLFKSKEPVEVYALGAFLYQAFQKRKASQQMSSQ
jgi:hypothetical protein